MREPEDYGLNPAQTLMQVAPSCPPPGFLQLWSSWRDRVWAQSPELRTLRQSVDSGAGALGVTDVLESVGNVRIGCRVITPASGNVRAVVITSHGYHVPHETPLSDEPSWTNRNLAVVKLRVRGFPGSQFDTGDLAARPEGFAAIGLETPGASILFQAVADVVNTVRAARARFGKDVPIFLHGESFGGGLAIIAASLLPRHLAPQRMAIGVPTLGWWGWRLAHTAHTAHTGAGRDIAAAIRLHRDREESIVETLGMLDAVVHARRVTAAALCKVAERDDVVPAPTAAAVCNALGSDPGRKWRFVTRYAHFDGGIADLRRHAMFDRLAAAFLDPSEDLDHLMSAWGSTLQAGDSAPTDSQNGFMCASPTSTPIKVGGY